MLVLQLNVALCPAAIVDGEAVRFTLRMSTVACAVALELPAPVAVAVYTVLVDGVITAEPERSTEV